MRCFAFALVTALVSTVPAPAQIDQIKAKLEAEGRVELPSSGLVVEKADYRHEGKAVEAVLVHAAAGGRSPALLVVPDHERSASDALPIMVRFALRRPPTAGRVRLLARRRSSPHAPLAQAKALDAALTHAGKPHRLAVVPGKGHALGASDVAGPAVPFFQNALKWESRSGALARVSLQFFGVAATSSRMYSC